jgi:hypothetical protein
MPQVRLHHGNIMRLLEKVYGSAVPEKVRVKVWVSNFAPQSLA